jgi:hypothetical protein
MKIFWLLPCLTVALMAADISGKWAGNIEVEDPSGGGSINAAVQAQFQQQSEAVSGTIGRAEDQESESIRNGKLVNGKQLTFEVQAPETSGTMKFVLTLDGDHLEGQMSGTIDSGPITGKVHLMRAASADKH